MSKRTVLFVESGTYGGGSFQSLMLTLETLDRSRFEPVVAFVNYTIFHDQVKELGISSYVLWDSAYSLHGWPGTLRRRAEGLVEHAFERRRPAVAKLLTGLVHAPLIRKLVRLVKRHGVDLIYCNNQINRDIFGVYVAVQMDIPMISHLRSPHGDSFTLGKAAFANEAVTAYISNSEETRNYWEGRGIDPVKNRVIHNGMPDFQVDPLDLHLSFGVPQDHFVVGCISRLLPLKGQDFLLHGFAALLRKLPQATLLLVGDGKFTDELKALVRELGIVEQVVFTGFESRAREIIASLDVLVQPSKFDSFGRTIGEAMRLKTPVIATDVGGIREIIRPGENGLLVPYGDVEALAVALADLKTDQVLHSKLVAKGVITVAETLDLDSSTRELEAIMDRVVEGGIC